MPTSGFSGATAVTIAPVLVGERVGAWRELFCCKIEPVNEQRIGVSMGRNGLTGMTSCEASVPVIWKR